MHWQIVSHDRKAFEIWENYFFFLRKEMLCSIFAWEESSLM